MRTICAALLAMGLGAFVLGCKKNALPTDMAENTEKGGGPVVAPGPAPVVLGKGNRGTFTIGKSTTFVTGPVDASGHIDYATALNEQKRQDVTPENNALVMIWNALGPNPFGETIPSGYFEKLGMPVPSANGSYYISLRTYANERLKDVPNGENDFLDKLSRCAQSPWAAKENPDLADWLKANAKSFALIREATKRPRYFTPIIPSKTSQGERDWLLAHAFPGLQPIREIVSGLTAQAMLAINEGRADDGWRDLLTCHRLGRLVCQSNTLIEALVGLAFERIASQAELIFLERASPTAEQLRGYLKDLTELSSLPDVATKVDLAERFMFLDGLMLLDRYGVGYMERLGGVKEAPPALAQGGLEGVDWNPALETVNQWFDRLVAATRPSDPMEGARLLSELRDAHRKHCRELLDSDTIRQKLSKLDAAKGKSRVIAEFMIATLPLTAAEKVQMVRYQAEQMYNNTRTAFAVAWYRRENDHYPKSLDALTPKYLPAVPKDLYSGRPLIYKPDANGFLLYSVGANGIDDGGHGSDAQSPGDDIVVRIPKP